MLDCLAGRLLRFGVHARLLALQSGDRGRRTSQRVVAATGLRERDHFPDRIGTSQQHADSVPAEGDATVRGWPKTERLEQETEFVVGFLWGDTQDVECPALDIGAVD